MYSCVPVGDASGGHSSIEGSRERMMRHLCICLHKSRHTWTRPRHHLRCTGHTLRACFVNVSRCRRGQVDVAISGTATTQIGPALQTHASEPGRTSSCQQLTNLAARSKSDGDGGSKLQ